MIWHVIPIDDSIYHRESLDCECNPEIETYDDSEDTFVIHNAQDGRLEENNELVLQDNMVEIIYE